MKLIMSCGCPAFSLSLHNKNGGDPGKPLLIKIVILIDRPVGWVSWKDGVTLSDLQLSKTQCKNVKDLKKNHTK